MCTKPSIIILYKFSNKIRRFLVIYIIELGCMVNNCRTNTDHKSLV